MKHKNKIIPLAILLIIALIALSIQRYSHSPTRQARRLLKEIRYLNADLNPLSDILQELDIVQSYDSRSPQEIFDDIAALDQSAQNIIIEALIDILIQDQPDQPRLKTNAAAALSNIGPTATPALLDLLNHSDIQTRLHAAAVLVHIDRHYQNPIIIQLCIDATKDPDPQFRLQAVKILHETGMYAAPAIPELIRLFSEDVWSLNSDSRTLSELYEYTSFALSEIGQPAIPALLQALNDQNILTQLNAAQTLTTIDPNLAASYAMPLLCDILQNDTLIL